LRYTTFIRETCSYISGLETRIHMWDWDMSHSCVRHDSFIFETWAIHMSHSYEWMGRVYRRPCELQHTATQCNTLQHTATRCNTLQHTATHCNKLLWRNESCVSAAMWFIHTYDIHDSSIRKAYYWSTQMIYGWIIPMTFDDWFVPMTYHFYVMKHIWLNHTNDICFKS